MGNIIIIPAKHQHVSIVNTVGSITELIAYNIFGSMEIKCVSVTLAWGFYLCRLQPARSGCKTKATMLILNLNVFSDSSAVWNALPKWVLYYLCTPTGCEGWNSFSQLGFYTNSRSPSKTSTNERLLPSTGHHCGACTSGTAQQQHVNSAWTQRSVPSRLLL